MSCLKNEKLEGRNKPQQGVEESQLHIFVVYYKSKARAKELHIACFVHFLKKKNQTETH
jgi:hypothetical protein